MRFVASLGPSADEAQDIAQETFARLYQQRVRHPEREMSVAWLYTVARRLVVDHWRARRDVPQDSLAQQTPSLERDPAAIVATRDAVARLLRRLPASERDCLVLFYFQDWTTERIAESLRIAPATVRVRLHRARERLRTLWLEEDQP